MLFSCSMLFSFFLSSEFSTNDSCFQSECVCSLILSVLENLGCKVKVMKMMSHNDPSVRKEALLAVQKLMVHNW